MVKISGSLLRCIVAAALLITCANGYSQGSSRILMDPGWVLVPSLSDEFNDSIIDPKKWTWNPPWGTYHGQPETSMACLTQKKPNRREEGGSLKLVVTPLKNTCHTWDGQQMTMPYSSGALYSVDTVKYGYFEIRIKIPDFVSKETEGMGVNFWMWHLMPYDDRVWSEIDIFEINSASNTQTCNVHYESHGMEQHWSMHEENHHKADIEDINFNNEWHVFSCEWTETSISFYHNGEWICSTNQYCADQLYMNLVLDINTPAINFGYTELAEEIELPYAFEIDYIRTYQKVSGPPATKSKKQVRKERKALQSKS